MLHRQSVFLCGDLTPIGHKPDCAQCEQAELTRAGLVGQSFSALCASSLEYVSAVSSFHSLSEAMLLFSLTLFRLVSSEHRFAPPLD